MDLSYDEIVSALRDTLVKTARNARSFGIRASGKPERLSAHSWKELAMIEALLSRRLEQALMRELHVEPWSSIRQARASIGGLVDGLRSEDAIVRRIAGAAARHPVEQWRQGAPQLEEALWPFFCARTRYLANTMALAIDEPAPHPPLVWNPGRGDFS